MSTPLKPCPFCGGPEPTLMSKELMGCGHKENNCYAMNAPEEWNHRTPGPATAKMIHHLSTVCGAFLRGGDPEPITMTIRPALVKAFLEEWEDPS